MTDVENKITPKMVLDDPERAAKVKGDYAEVAVSDWRERECRDRVAAGDAVCDEAKGGGVSGLAV